MLFTGFALVLGSLWGRPVWGFWWAWDARLVSTALLFFLFLGYLALRRIPGDPVGAAKRNAIAALIAFVDVPIVHFSVEWWRTLHQKATVFNPQLNPKIHGVMGLTLWIGTIAFTLVYVYLLDRRYRLAVLEEGAGRPRARAGDRRAHRHRRPRRQRGRAYVTDAGYVIAAWSLTAVVLGGYTVRLTRRVRRAERERAESEREG